MSSEFNFGKANEKQIEAITTVDGPVLITAGPGTGKTFTLVKRAVYLIQECGIKPENIMMATFTEKAAKELIARITDELDKNNIEINLNEMYIGTFHSICLRILKEHLEFTRISNNFRTMDDFDCVYMVYKELSRFEEIPGINDILSKYGKPISGKWNRAKRICNVYVQKLSEELINNNDIAKLKNDSNPKIITLGEMLELYKTILNETNQVDFAAIQVETYKLLTNHPIILADIHNKIKYLMIDEYQDTNYIQERLVFLIGGLHKNICVVGDEDQALYRFRGATVRNILEFQDANELNKIECKIIPLVINYRSNVGIINFYNKWMNSPVDFRFDNFRHEFSSQRAEHPKKQEHSAHYEQFICPDRFNEFLF